MAHSDKNEALLWDYQLDGKGGGVQRHQARQPDTGGFDWFHLKSDDPAARSWMRAQGFDGRVIEALTVEETRPRMLMLADGILVVLRGVNTNPGADPEDMVSLRLWFDGSRIVSARRSHRRLLAVEDVRQLIESKHGPVSPGDMVAMFCEQLDNRIADVIDAIDAELCEVEADISESGLFELQQKVSGLRRRSATLRRFLAPQRDALAELYQSRGILSEDESHRLHIQRERITRFVEELDLARERALVLNEDFHYRVAEQQNTRMYLLSIVAVIFLPLSFLSGVFGMNVGGLPGLDNPQAFYYLAGGMSLLAIAMLILMRLKKWL